MEEDLNTTREGCAATPLLPTADKTEKKKCLVWSTLFHIAVYVFAVVGFGIIGAWAFYQLGFTKNKGAVDENYRYLMSVSEIEGLKDNTLTPRQRQEQWSLFYTRLAAFSKFYPVNARLIMDAVEQSDDPSVANRMLAAASIYTGDNEGYQQLLKKLSAELRHYPQQDTPNAIPWMNTIEWEALKGAILKDSALLCQAGEICGVEPRLIVGCLVGEQIRLFNSKREMFKKYLGPVKVLSVQSQFSYGVNGVKEFTAKAVEEHLKDTASPFYMGKHYENILDFETQDHSNERYRRLVDYRNHLYSYIYTGCILHQTMLQWRRAGYDISDRPDILFTLFNVGFSQSQPKANPRCGGSHINVDGRLYTFGAVGFDFYYSGELAKAFPYWHRRFIPDNGTATSATAVDSIQRNVSNCSRPEKGLEYKNQNAVQGADAVNVTSDSRANEAANVGGSRPF